MFKKDIKKSNNIYKVLFWIVLVILVFTFFSGNECDHLSNDECNDIRNQYNDLVNQYNQLNQQKQTASLEPPYIYISNRTVTITFRKIDKTIHSWTVPFSSLESDIRRGFFKREFFDEYIIPLSANLYGSYEGIFLGCSNSLIQMCNEYQVLYSACGGSGSVGCKDLKDNLQDSYDDFIEEGQSSILGISKEGKSYINLIDSKTGEEVTVMDFRPFIDSKIFGEVIKTLHQESSSDGEFIREVWNIVTQLNTYSTEIEETPRYPLETFLAGGGDCEDSSILLASMLKSAPTNWDVQLVYMDADNPENPQEVNHVLVFVDTGKEQYFIETTNNQEMQPYDYIDGWYLDI